MQTKLLKIIFCPHRNQYSQPCQKVFVKGLKVFCSYLEKIKTPVTFSKNLNLFKGFLSTRRFQVRQSCSKYSDKMLKKFEQKTKLIKIYTFSSKKPSLKCSSWQVEYSFYNRKSYARCPKLTENFCFKKLSSNFIYRDEKMQFIQPGRRKLAEWANFFLSKSAKELKTWISCFIEMFLRTIRIDYWQPHWKTLTRNQTFFAQYPKKKEEI